MITLRLPCFPGRLPGSALLVATLLLVGPTRAQNPNGFIYTDQWLALGPFTLLPEWDCDQPDADLVKEYIAPSSMAVLVPGDGDEIDYDPGVAATVSYDGPLGATGLPGWRPFMDGTGGEFFPDEDLDMEQDAANAGALSLERITTFVATYFEYLGDDPIDVEACIGSDDSVQAWLDKELVLSNNDCRGRNMTCQDLVPLKILPGLHRIAMAVFERGGSFGGSFGFRNDGQFITDTDPDWRFLGTDADGLVFPEAKFTVDVSSGPVPLTVQFDATASTTPSGSITKYHWDFGDGESMEGVQVSHAYQKGYFFTARLTVTNSARGSDSAEQVIDARVPPQAIPGWSSADVGGPALAGGEQREGDCIGVFAGATAIGDVSDQFHFTHLPKAGTSYTLTAQLREVLWQPGAVAGIMIRETLDPGSRFAFFHALNLGAGGGNQYTFLTRKTPGARASASRPAEPVPFPEGGYLRLERSGNEIHTHTSPDGNTWTPYLSTIFATLSESLLAGYAVAAGDSDSARQAAHATFCNSDFAPAGGQTFHRGDADSSGKIDITDGIFILSFLFQGGPAPSCLEAANTSDEPRLAITAGIFILSWLFQGGPAPPAPGPIASPCGPDPPGSPSDLGCASYTHCLQ